MSIALKQYETYQNTQLQTASREELLLTTFDWLLASVRRGLRSATAGRHATARKSLMTAQSGVLYLMGTLDMATGGELAMSLRTLYIYILRRLAEAAVDLEIEPIEESLRLLSGLAETFQEAAAQTRSQQ